MPWSSCSPVLRRYPSHAVFHDPTAPIRILAELEAELAVRGFGSVREAIGFAHKSPGEQTEFFAGRSVEVSREDVRRPLDHALTDRGSVCVGIDPHPGLLTNGACPMISARWRSSP